MTAVAERSPETAAGTRIHSEMSAAEANRVFYADYASKYDSVEHCATKAAPRQFLSELLGRAIGACSTVEPRTLDACGGTGNVSELLARRGISTTVADISPEMLSVWEAKASQLGVVNETVVARIDDFLTEDERLWDLIVFSSALHHMDDYVEVAGLAADRLAPGGVVVTVHDPTPPSGATVSILRRFDYLLSLALDPRALLAAFGRKSRARRKDGVNVGAIAERHVAGGVDDEAVIRRFEQGGLEVVEHRRYADERYRLTESILRAMRLTTTFHLIARKPAGHPSETSTASE